MKPKLAARITTRAVFIALVIAVQAATAAFGQLVTGSLVNLILIISVITGGLASGITVALISPLFARLLGIGPLWAIVPFIMAGNAVLVTLWHVVGKKKFSNMLAARIVALLAAAACKFLTLYIGIARITVPYILLLPEPQASGVANIFSLPQLFTSLAGGAAAIAILPIIEKARSSLQSS